MLYKSNFSIGAAVANCSGAMEAETISRNGAILKSQKSKGNNLFALVFVILAGLFMQSCGISSKVTKTANFNLTPKTPTAVIINDSRNANKQAYQEFCLQLETELLGVGFNVVPYEVAKKNATTTEFSSNTNADNINSTTMTYVKTYIPASIAVSVLFRDGAVGAVPSVFRVIDLSNNQLLAVFEYTTRLVDGYPPLRFGQQFVNDLSQYLQHK